MQGDKKSKTFEIALSAISCALAVIFLLVGTLSGVLLATGYLMGAVCLMIPLAKNFYAGDALAYVGTCILAVVLGALGGGWTLVPFIAFFGLHPLANALQLRFKINGVVAFLIKAVWFDLALYLMYILVFGSSIASPDFEFYKLINDNIVWFIAIGGTVFFAVYDFAIFKCQTVINTLIKRIKKD
jgi:hypothetical protein